MSDIVSWRLFYKRSSVGWCYTMFSCYTWLWNVLYLVWDSVLLFVVLFGPGKWKWVGHSTIDLIMHIWRLLLSINWISSIKEINPITRKSMAKLVTQPSFRVVGQTHTEWQTFEKPKNNRQMYGGRLTTIHLSLISRLFKCLSFRVCLAYNSETWLHY